MIFHAAEKDLDFVVAGKRYIVSKGESVDIHDAVAYCIKRRGIALAEGHGPKAVTVKPTKPAVKPRIKRSIDIEEARAELAEVVGPGDDDDDIDN